MDKSSDRFLAFFEFVWLFFTALVIVDQEWLDEIEELVNCAGLLQWLVVLDHSFADA